MVFLVRFGELALKSRYVRRQLQDRLVANLLERFTAEGKECLVSSDFGRIYVHADDTAAAASILARTFGIVSFSPAAEAPSDLPALCGAVAAYAKPLLSAGMSFAIRPRRSGTHPYKSQDLGREAGSAVWTAVPGLRVDLEKPDREISVEVREWPSCSGGASEVSEPALESSKCPLHGTWLDLSHPKNAAAKS